MSYREQGHSLADPLGQILTGIANFDKAVTARIESNAWIPEHTAQIHDLSVRLMSLRHELSRLAQENW